MSIEIRIDSGGPAFPHVLKNEEEVSIFVNGCEIPAGCVAYFHGMTLRDYFAARAMQSALNAGRPNTPDRKRLVAEWAYSIADAMLEARNGE